MTPVIDARDLFRIHRSSEGEAAAWLLGGSPQAGPTR